MMTSNSAPSTKSNSVEELRKQYQDCNRTIEQLTQEIRLCGGWEVDQIRTLNTQLEQACKESKTIMQVWNDAIDAMETDNSPVTYTEWEATAKLIPSGYRIKDGWFCDSYGRSTKSPVLLTPRELSIIAGDTPINS